MTRLAAERVFVALLALVAAALLPEAVGYRGGSQYFPTVLLAALLALCAAALLRTRRAARGQDHEAFFTDGGRFAAAVVLIGAYTLALPHVGYFTSSALFIAAMAWTLGFREPRMILLTVVGFLVFVWVVFQGIFQRDMAREFFMPWLLGY